MERMGLRRRVTLSEQLSVVDSSNLRDLFEVREEVETSLSRRRGRSSVTLGSVIACEKREGSVASGSGRTLLDVIQREHDQAASWRSLRNNLLHAGATWDAASSGQPHPISDSEPVVSARPNRVLSVQNSEPAVQESTAIAAAAAATISDPGGSAESSVLAATLAEQQQQQPERVSLMALLEQTDRHGGGGGSDRSSLLKEAEGGGGGMSYACCVCMVRHKAAAFIPCGHAFCRLCSRQLWLSRANCPLCNAFILDILHIF